ncbi:unnamed protein product, partial [Ectocarpus sp. 12 AP-2014]
MYGKEDCVTSLAREEHHRSTIAAAARAWFMAKKLLQGSNVSRPRLDTSTPLVVSLETRLVVARKKGGGGDLCASGPGGGRCSQSRHSSCRVGGRIPSVAADATLLDRCSELDCPSEKKTR